MPSKELLNKVKEYRAALNEETIERVLLAWATASAQPQVADLQGLSDALLDSSASTAQKDKLEAALLAYRAQLQQTLADIATLKAAILLRIPEYKQEDNHGVEVQLEVLKQLGGFEKLITGGSSGKDEGGASIPAVSVLKDYLAARAAIEEKLLGTEKDGPSKAPSLARQASVLDSDVAAKLAVGVREVVLQKHFIVTLYAQNAKKLLNPRTTSDRMLS